MQDFAMRLRPNITKINKKLEFASSSEQPIVV